MSKHSKQKSNLKYIIIIICVLAIISGIGYFAYQKYKGNSSEDIYKDIKVSEPNINIAKVKSLQQENAEVKGWIHIDDQMFNTLLKYEDKNFYDTHKTIKIATDSEEHEYSIVCAFKSRMDEWL